MDFVLIVVYPVVGANHLLNSRIQNFLNKVTITQWLNTLKGTAMIVTVVILDLRIGS